MLPVQTHLGNFNPSSPIHLTVVLMYFSGTTLWYVSCTFLARSIAYSRTGFLGLSYLHRLLLTWANPLQIGSNSYQSARDTVASETRVLVAGMPFIALTVDIRTPLCQSWGGRTRQRCTSAAYTLWTSAFLLVMPTTVPGARSRGYRSLSFFISFLNMGAAFSFLVSGDILSAITFQV